MPVDVPLQQMSLAEKLELMEALWADLSRDPGAFASPEWHREELEETRRKAETGEEQFTDWEVAQEEIRRRVS